MAVVVINIHILYIILHFLYSASLRITDKYISNDSVYLYKFMRINFDKEHTVETYYYINDIRICYINKTNNSTLKTILVYKSDEIIFSSTIKNNIPNYDFKVVYKEKWTDEFGLINKIRIYSSGVIIYTNPLIRYIYNKNKRETFSKL